MMQPVVAYSPYPGSHPHQRLHHLHHHHAPPPPPAHQQQHHLLHQPPPQQTYPLHHDVYAPQPQTYHAPLLLAPAYRPLQIPMQQQQQQQQQQLQHSSPVVAPEQQQQLALAQQQVSTPAFPSSSQASAPDPGLHLHQQPQQHHHNSLHSNHSQHPVAAAYPQQQQRRDRSQQSSMAYQPSDEEMAEMQRLSAAYESEATGPLVGQRQPSSAITQEYATADATYQTKTAALPQKYSHYRKVRGDGKCGWRAVAFGYLERLLYIGDSGKFYEEEARLRSLSNVLNQAGFEPYLYEDFADELFGLIRSIANAINEGNGDEVLMNAFNDESTQNYVITHFKTLTAAWMKTHPENYAGYMIGQTVDQYCDEHIMPMDGEIDHLGLSALKDVILSPASLALEVTYLDRSVGEEVNLHRFDPISGYTASTVRLLYRPFVPHPTCTPRSLLTKTSGHYDLLYKYEDVPLPTPPPPPPAQESVAAYLQQNAPHPDYVPIGDFSDATDNLMFIPGMSIAPTHGWMSGPSYGSDFFATPFAPVQTCAQTLPSPVAPAPQPQMLQQAPIQPAYTSAPQVSHVLPPTQMPTDLPIRSSGPMPHADHVIESQPEPQCQTGGMFRPSVYNSTVDGYAASIPQMPLVTPSFKNSHYNPSHFQNPDFQPEQWVPDDEYVTTTNTKASSRSHRSSG